MFSRVSRSRGLGNACRIQRNGESGWSSSGSTAASGIAPGPASQWPVGIARDSPEFTVATRCWWGRVACTDHSLSRLGPLGLVHSSGLGCAWPDRQARTSRPPEWPSAACWLLPRAQPSHAPRLWVGSSLIVFSLCSVWMRAASCRWRPPRLRASASPDPPDRRAAADEQTAHHQSSRHSTSGL